jgi:hypothetical protein
LPRCKPALGSGGFGFDFAVGGAVPEPSTWVMMLLGFVGFGLPVYRQTRKGLAVTVVEALLAERSASQG